MHRHTSTLTVELAELRQRSLVLRETSAALISRARATRQRLDAFILRMNTARPESERLAPDK